MKPAIRVENLSKNYRLGTRAAGCYRTLRETISDSVTGAWHGLRRHVGGANNGHEKNDAFWALKDVSFEIQPGEVVGIIGRNGAGKSTLLKVLSRIVEPTGGRCEVRGRMGSLLEVGTGFHPELTGRENIYMNGCILGMKRAEIDRKFDEIVAFSEIEQFLDTPVKRYSSGMYVRLAFAVAAHMDTEILLVDEVLAVGDAGFQKKCLGKMNSVSKDGRTVIFVSHNMPTVRALCNRCLVMQSGKLIKEGTPELCIEKYAMDASRFLKHSVNFTRPSSECTWMTNARITTDSSQSGKLCMGDPIKIEVEYQASVPIRHPQLGFVISTITGDKLILANTHFQSTDYPAERTLAGKISCDLGVVPFMSGTYSVSLWFGTQNMDTHVVEDALQFEVQEKDIWGTGKAPPKASYLWWPTTFSFSSIKCREASNGR